MDERPLVYLDNAATSWPKPPGVIDAMLAAASIPQTAWRSTFSPGDRIVREASTAAKRVFGDCEVMFGLNCTHSVLLALRSLNLGPGDAVVTSDIEHNAIVDGLEDLVRRGVRVVVARADLEGFVAADALAAAWQTGIRLACLTHASNVFGAVNDLAALSEYCHAKGAALLVDASQTAGEVGVSVSETGADIIVASGHKGLMGPSGVGLLCFSRKSAFLDDGLRTRTTDQLTSDGGADGPEQPGTPNLVGLAGLSAAIAWLECNASVGAWRRDLVGLMVAGLDSMKHVTIHGPRRLDSRVGLLSFNVEGLEPSLIGQILSTRHGVVTRTGLHCAPAAHRVLGTYPAGSVRASPGPFSTTSDVELLLGALRELQE